MSRFEHKEGQRVPEATFRRLTDKGLETFSTDDIFKGKTVVAFSLPGAFTPTCSSTHVPGYEAHYDQFKAAGIDDVVVLSVNDAFVMAAWEKDQGTHKVTYLADGDATFTKGMSLALDKVEVGFGVRSWRYSMLVKDGVIEKMFIEPDVPGDPFEVSDADTMRAYLGLDKQPSIAMVTKPGCGHCRRAKEALDAAGLPYAEIPSTQRLLEAVPGAGTTPQVFIDGAHIGDGEALHAWLAKRG